MVNKKASTHKTSRSASPRAPRIALVIGSMVTGGAQRVALNLLEEFAARGMKVDLIPLVARGTLLDELPPNVSLVLLSRGRGRSSVFALRKYIRRVRPSAVIAFTFHVNLLTALAHLGLGRRTRLILSVHSAFSGALREYPLFTRTIFRPATSLLYRGADAIVAVSDGAADDLARVAKIDRRSIFTIHNPVLGQRFHAAVSEPIKHPWVGTDVPLLVAVGRLTEAKDYPTLIQAFARVRGQTEARLLILGEGEKRTEIEAMIGDRGLGGDVELLGHVRNPLPWMKAADLFVLASTREGFGNVLVEAMATGTPVVSTDCRHGPSEILEAGRWGRLVPIRDHEALAAAIVETLKSGGVSATARAQSFTVESAADQYLKLL